MIISLRQVSRFLRMLIFVALFSFICYKVLAIVHVMIQPTHKYKEPVGSDALKVSAQMEQSEAEPVSGWQEIIDRLSIFYQIGE